MTRETEAAANAPAAAPVDISKIPFRHLLFGLFFYPQVLLPLLYRRVGCGRALRMVVGACLVSGVVAGAAKLPRLLARVEQWATWGGEEVGALWFEGERLQWERPATVPYTTRHQGWRFDFAATDAPFKPDSLKGPEERGVWISSEKILVWWWTARNSAVAFTVYSEGKLLGFLPLRQVWPEGLRLPGSRFEPETRRLLFRALPFLLLHQILALLLPVMIYTLVFTMIPILFRSPISALGFASTYSFHLYASIPPLLVATLYSILDVPFLDVGTVFVGAFILYLFLIFATVRRQAARDQQ